MKRPCHHTPPLGVTMGQRGLLSVHTYIYVGGFKLTGDSYSGFLGRVGMHWDT